MAGQMLDLKQNGMFIMQVAAGRRFVLPDGRIVSPATPGWELDGYTLTLAEPPGPDPIPHEAVEVTRMIQFRRALRQLGYHDTVRVYMEGRSEDMKEVWDKAFRVQRHSNYTTELLTHLGAQTGKTVEMLKEEIFSLADTLSDAF